ncbi:hypothetical protein SAMN05444161_3888 [Rhizobiales bacterium GAS191]|nr:hypothetical protein SAMN05444161_3888 [Rhizobiales bacterium GAS191]
MIEKARRQEIRGSLTKLKRSRGIRAISGGFGHYTNKRLGEHRFYNYAWVQRPKNFDPAKAKSMDDMPELDFVWADLKQEYVICSIEVFLRLFDCHEDFIPIYIGKGQGNRAAVHVVDMARGVHPNRLLQRVWEKIEWEDEDDTQAVAPYLIVSNKDEYDHLIGEDEAYALEIEMISHIGRRDLRTGPLCNLTGGGPGTKDRVISEAELAVLSAGRVKLWQDPDYRAHMHEILSEAMKGKWQDPVFREKQLAAIRNAEQTVVARKISDEEKRQMSERWKALYNDPSYREALTNSFKFYDAFLEFYRLYMSRHAPATDRVMYRKEIYAQWRIGYKDPATLSGDLLLALRSAPREKLDALFAKYEIRLPSDM